NNNNNNNNNNSDNVTVGTSGYIGTLNKQSQQIILNVFQYFTKPRQGKGAIVETEKGVGISRQAVSRIVYRGPGSKNLRK
ncbi:hypothetical protein C0J52_00864, partial [Blattella germanica]